MTASEDDGSIDGGPWRERRDARSPRVRLAPDMNLSGEPKRALKENGDPVLGSFLPPDPERAADTETPKRAKP